MKIALAGQPNCGKSTFFNAVVGYRSLTSNFAGTTVEFAQGQTRINGEVIDLYDLPGLYSLIPSNPAETSSRDCLLDQEWDVIVNVVDASQLARSLELTFELTGLERPMIVCLNMMDEALRKGMTVDVVALSEALGVPVVETIAARGRGIAETLHAAMRLHHEGDLRQSRPSIFPREVESVIGWVASNLRTEESCSTCACGGSTPDFLDNLRPTLNSHPVAEMTEAAHSGLHSARAEALLLLEGDPQRRVGLRADADAMLRHSLAVLARGSSQAPEEVIPCARHAACLRLFERVVRIERPRADWREQADRLVMHPLWGYVFLAAGFIAFFHLIFDVGKLGETEIMALFDSLTALVSRHLDPGSLGFVTLKGALLGTAGAFGAVLPYLIPFLLGLALLEDLGYLARIGYLMDAAMHRLGLHGTATLPVLLGYGCSVPAVMATRILHSRRDRFLATFLAILVPCSARTMVILALVGFYLGTNWALAIYAINFLVVALAGVALARIWPQISPGMLMEVPPYRVPAPRVVLLKTWWRLREFIVVATPLLIAGSIMLSVMEYFGWQRSINGLLAPLTHLLGLPSATGLTLIFGVMRKEMSLVMLMQALGTSNVHAAMSTVQIVVFTLFVTFYLPCLATVIMMFKEVGWKLTAAACGVLLVLATVVGVVARVVIHLAG